MLSLAATLGVPVAQEAATLDSSVALVSSAQDGCFGDNEYYMTAPGGNGGEGGHLFIYSSKPHHPPPGTEIELSGLGDMTWIVDDDPTEWPKDPKELKNKRSFQVSTATGEPTGIPYDKQRSAPCYGENLYYATASGGEGHDGGEMYVYSHGQQPVAGTKVTLSQYPDLEWVVEEEPKGNPKDPKELADPLSFAVHTANNKPHGIPYDKQNSQKACFGENKYFMTASGGDGHHGGHLFVFSTGLRPEIGTKIVLSQYPDLEWVVDQEPESNEAHFEKKNPKAFSIVTSDGGPHHIPYEKQNAGTPDKAMGTWKCSTPNDLSKPIGNWKCVGAPDADPTKVLGSWSCVGVTPQITVHGDPIFRFGDSHNATRLWLPTGELTPLLQWTEEKGGKQMQLLGKTFHPRTDCKHDIEATRKQCKANNEWFDELAIMYDGVRVLDVNADQEQLGTMRVALDDNVMEPEPGKRIISPEHHRVSFTASKRPKTDMDQISVAAGGLELTIFISKATKFKGDKLEHDRIKYAHLNMMFDNGLPKNGKGVFAELAGMEDMTPETAKLLERPKDLA